MATDKTPPGKRIQRAEDSAAEWKLKSIERREENERLSLKLQVLEAKLEKIKPLIPEKDKRIRALEREIEQASQVISTQQSEIENLRKKRRA